MPLPFGIRNRTEALPLTARTIDVSSDDFEDENGVMVRVGTTGMVAYRALGSRSDVVESFTAGDLIPPVVQAIRATGTTATGLAVYGWEREIGNPTAPQTLTSMGEPADEEITLSWEAPADDGGVDIFRYQVRVGTGAYLTIGNVLSYTFRQAFTGTSVVLGVRAQNIEGNTGPVASLTVSDSP